MNPQKKPRKKAPGWYWQRRKKLLKLQGVSIVWHKKTIYAPLESVNPELTQLSKRYNLQIQLIIN